MSQEELSWLQENVLVGFTDPKYGRGTAWHYDEDEAASVSNHFPDAIPVETVVERLFNWSAEEVPLVVRRKVGGTDDEPIFDELVDERRKVIVQPLTKKILGVHHKTYAIHQFSDWLLDRVAMIIGDDLQVGSAGKLRQDALAWVSVELPESLETKEGVAYRPRLLARTSHDGTASTGYSGHCTIVVCDNTLAIGMSEADGRVFRVRHTANSAARITDAHEALGFVHTMADDFAKEVASLTKTRVSDQQFERFINTLVPLPEDEGRGRTIAQTKQSILTRLWREDDRVAPWKNTAWGALMTTNTAGQHEYGVRGHRSERNFTNTVYGFFEKDDRKALTTLQAVLA